MSWILLLAIRCYRAVWPPRWKRGCLFRESCSRHVYRVARQNGLAAGVRALRERFGSCRPGYALVTCHGESWLVLANGSVLPAHEAAPTVLGR